MARENEKLKRCPKCGNFFGCAADGDCWCHTVQVPQRNLKKIMDEFPDCLCPDCLKQYEVL